MKGFRITVAASIFVATATLGCIEVRNLLLSDDTPSRPPVPPRFRDLGSIGGDTRVPRGINDHGTVVGFAANADGQDRAFRWTPEEGMVELPTAGGEQARAFAVNNNGVICGISRLEDEEALTVAVVWMPDGEIRVLPHLANGTSEANDINDLDQVVGGSNDEDDRRQAVLWESDDSLVVLGSLGGEQSLAQAINNMGQVTGASETSVDQEVHTFLWSREGGMMSLGSLGGNLSDGQGIDDLGRVVGRSNFEFDGQRVAFIWTSENGMVSLGTLGGTGSQAEAINNRGEVVGSSAMADGGQKAFYVQLGIDGMFQLPDLNGFTLNVANAINNSSVITGSINGGFQQSRAVIWEVDKPVEESAP